MARPKKLQTIVAEEMKKSMISTARRFVHDTVEDKLRDRGIDPGVFPVGQLVEHIMVGADETFVWTDSEHDGRTQNGPIALDLNRQDVSGLSTQIGELLKNADAFYRECLDSAANLFVQTLEKDWPQQKLAHDVELYGFRKRLEYTWGAPLDMFRMMLAVSRELFTREVESLEKSKAKHTLYLREALLGIHARALRTATAVLALLENGLADDAYARWRTLYELSVTATFLSEHGERVAERYLAHEAVVLKSRLDNELSWASKRISNKQRQEIERSYSAVLSAYGDHFKYAYGWAADFVDNCNPKFATIEKSVKGKMTAPPYKESSLQIHGGRAGLLGLSSSDHVAAVGHSNLGLEIPLMHSSLCLMQVTNIHLYNCPSRDVVILGALMALDKRIDKQCRRVARELARDTA